jgi:hypothetical protein
MVGSLAAVPEGVAACEIAVPPRPHINSAIDELIARVDENLTAMSSQCGAANSTLDPKDYHVRMQIGPLSISNQALAGRAFRALG